MPKAKSKVLKSKAKAKSDKLPTVRTAKPVSQR
jgi:hypothetical protein